MKEITKKWLAFASSDLEAAEILNNSKKIRKRTMLLILWHCHQTIEKSFKAVMIEKNIEIFKIHDLLRLVDLSKIKLYKDKENKKALEEETLEFIGKLNKYYIRPRYPDLGGTALPKVDKEITDYYLKGVKKLFAKIKNEIS